MAWGKRAAAVLAAAVFGGLLITGTASATTQTVCGSTSTPAGWVETRYWDSSQCGTYGGMYNTKQITDTSGVAPGGTTLACTYSPIPSGFWVNRYFDQFTCARSSGSSDYLNQESLVRLTGLPSGTRELICGVMTVPTGWTVELRYHTSECEQYKGGWPITDNTMRIRKV